MAWFDWRSDSTVCCAASLSCVSASLICCGAGRLRLHALIDDLEARRERLHLLDDLRQLRADLPNFLHAAAHLLGELVHAHHAGGHRRLHFLDHLFDVIGRHRRLVGEPADFRGHHREAAAVFAGLLGFDGGVERQQVGLVGHLGDRGDDRS